MQPIFQSMSSEVLPMSEKLQIRNSTAEFLIFASQNEGNSIEVRFEDNTLWLTQQLIAELFQTSVPNISMHIKSIYEDKELEVEATLKNFLTVRQEGSRQVNRNLEYYNLDMIIAVGYRVIQDRLFKSDFDKQMELFNEEDK